jgi:uncharacterized OB-fold protein
MTEEASTVAPVLPAPSELTAFFWDGARQGRLLIQQCNNCHRYQHPPEPICHHCLSFDLGSGEVSGRGTVYTYEIATQAFHPYFADKLPYVIGVVELAEQPNLKLITNLVDFPDGTLAVGAPVQVRFHPLNDEFSLPVFGPAAG